MLTYMTTRERQELLAEFRTIVREEIQAIVKPVAMSPVRTGKQAPYESRALAALEKLERKSK